MIEKIIFETDILVFFVWFIIKNNKTGNSFFDEYLSILHQNFKAWYMSLARDWSNLDTVEGSGTPATKKGVLMLISHYNFTHPDTQVKIEDLI